MKTTTQAILFSSFLFLALSWQCFATFSIVAVDPATGEVGSAGASCLDDSDIAGGVFIITRIHPGKGAINTQSYWNQSNQNNASAGMTSFGLNPQEIIDLLAADDAQNDPQIRQYGIVDFDDDGNPRSAGFTGTDCFDWKGHVAGETYSIQGNILLDDQVLAGMVAAFEAAEGEPLAIRLMAALQAANLPGADSRCFEEGVSSQSAFIRVAKPDDDPEDLWLDLRVGSTAFGVEPIDILQAGFDSFWDNEFGTECLELPSANSLTFDNLPAAMDESFSQEYIDLFGSYKLASDNPNHGLILFSENGTASSLHASQVFELFTRNVNNDTFGDKASLRDELSTTSAALAIFENEAQLESPEAEALWQCDPKIQDLWQTEIVRPGSIEWLSMSKRDASYEEILHFVQDYGITESNADLQEDIQAATDAAIANGSYIPLSDLEPEDYDNEFFAITMECFYGLWAHDPNGDGFAGDGEYPYITREAIEENDPTTYSLLTSFFASANRVSIVVDAGFDGDFHMTPNENAIYSQAAQYHRAAILTGSNNSNIIGNNFSNNLRGNAGDNAISGMAGFDLVDGDEGQDTLVLRGSCIEYDVLITETGFIYQDQVAGRDGIHEIINMEWVRYSDCLLAAGEISTGLSELEEDITIYPNPVQNGSPIYFELNTVIEDIRLIALDGKLILNEKVEGATSKIDLPTIQNGIYFLEFIDEEGKSSVRKIIIE